MIWQPCHLVKFMFYVEMGRKKKALPLTSELEGITRCWCVAENGLTMYMWIGMNVNPEWVQQVFGVQSAAQIDIDKVRQFGSIFRRP